MRRGSRDTTPRTGRTRDRGKRGGTAPVAPPALRHAGRSSPSPRCSSSSAPSASGSSESPSIPRSGATRAARSSQDETVQQTLATYLVDQVYANVDVAAAAPEPRCRPAPSRSPRLPPPACTTARSGSRSACSHGPRAAGVARREQGRPISSVIRMIDDEGRFVRTNGGEVALDLRPIVQQVVGRVGLTDRVEGRLPPNAGQHRARCGPTSSPPRRPASRPCAPSRI